MAVLHSHDALFRWQWHIRGQVQGVGFRPFCYRIAMKSHVTGRVMNDASGVFLEIQGDAGALERFAEAYVREMPPLAKVASCQKRAMPVVGGEEGFVIEQSSEVGEEPVAAAVTIDSAVCPDCLREMGEKGNRRYGHALINCTNCGPRYSIIRNVPYDRPNTTMRNFEMCPACRKEYEDAGDRRFHAQPTCCPECGPKVELVRMAGGVVSRKRAEGGAAIKGAAKMLWEGKIVAIKGIGGFHLAVRADSEEAVGRLRTLKKRDAKPFALMCRDMEMVRQLVRMSAAGEAELCSVGAPIVLSPRKEGVAVASAVAAGTDLLGVMLPYTPMQHLLWGELGRLAGKEGGKEAGGGLPALVMTSGNRSNEPLVIDNEEASKRLGGLCDGILWHDRPIERCVDDSVVLDRGEGREVLPLRRSRGYVPTAFAVSGEHKTGICVGGELKNTMAVVRRHDVILSQHLGDLSHALAFEHFQKAVRDLIKLFDVRVEFVAHDLHPSYMSTMAAHELARRFGAKLIPVQHHVAHAAAVMAEHHLEGRVLAVVCDGTGYGTDGTIWGGELLELNGAKWRRLGRLRPMRLPGGDAAALDPRRSGLALLHATYGEEFEGLPAAAELFPDEMERRMLGRMIRTGLNSPWTSSTGRLFDGVAALLGICRTNEHEAQAAMALEAAAWRVSAEEKPMGGTQLGAGHGGERREWLGRGEGEDLFEVRWNAEAGLWELDLSLLIRWLVEQAGESGQDVGGRGGVGADVPSGVGAGVGVHGNGSGGRGGRIAGTCGGERG